MIVQMFFNSIFSSIDIEYENEEDSALMQIPDTSKKYNIDIINAYLLGLMKANLSDREYDAIDTLINTVDKSQVLDFL